MAAEAMASNSGVSHNNHLANAHAGLERSVARKSDIIAIEALEIAALSGGSDKASFANDHAMLARSTA
jgi:hypothetical protein